MVFRDTKLTCQSCGKPFFFTVTEQRQIAEKLGAEAVVPPELCPQCRQSAKGQAVPQAPAQPAAEQRVERSAKPPAPAKPAVEEPIERSTQVQPLDELEEFPLQVEGIEIKLIGRVKWYSREKGYGFVTTANDQDIFFHRANLVDRNTRLDEDDRVEFQVRQTNKGPEAFNVSLLPVE